MKIEMRQITRDDPLITELPEHHPMVEETEELEAWFIDGRPVVLIGFCPASLLSTNAYVWSWVFPAVLEYKKTFLRASRRLLKDTLSRHPVLYGHCAVNSKWMRHLGAKIVPVTDTLATFTIEAQ